MADVANGSGGRGLDWEFAMRRQAVAEWRDRQILLAHASINSKAQEALGAFEEQAAKASVLDSAWDPSRFADARIDALMKQRVVPLLGELLAGAEKELVLLGDCFADLGRALARSDAVTLPEFAEAGAGSEVGTTPKIPAVPDMPATEAPPEEGSWLKRLPSIAVERATTIAKQASETADWVLQDKVGLRDRLRVAASNRIAAMWMGGTGDPKPVLAQVISLIDEVAHQARTSLL